MKVMVTGTAGFIGCHVAMRLLERGDEVIGIKNVIGRFVAARALNNLQR